MFGGKLGNIIKGIGNAGEYGGGLKGAIKGVGKSLTGGDTDDKLDAILTAVTKEENPVVDPLSTADPISPLADTAKLAGGSKPMTSMNNTQIDPITGMPFTPGGQPNMTSNFIGNMSNSVIPTTNQVAQERRFNKYKIR
tara:strand:- start:136 stop:552 length:417 start_codon:yes stop_codon:yes gene_type:complete